MFGQRGRPRISGLPFNKMIPNILTLLALCAGLTSMRFGLQGKWDAAVWAILLAALLDTLDGRIARMLHGTSKFGAELDSLSDFVSFGVAPSMVLYLWTMQNAGGFGWALVLMFSVCCALRLARFNTMIGAPDLPPWAYNFFTGVPAPAAAGLALLPMVISFLIMPGFFQNPVVVGAVLVTVALLMVSSIPTYSFKRFRIPHKYVLPTLLFVGLFAAFLVTEPWATIAVVGLVYVASIPLSMRSFARQQSQAPTAPAPGEDERAAEP